ncbi:MAG: sulfatase-like hydrolase/transferase [Coraliomargaritaceae bacterium]
MSVTKTYFSLVSMTVMAVSACHLYSGTFIHSERAQSKRPNIIFILTDDHRADHVGFMGNPIVKTPHLDRLAALGTVFENAFVTSAICTPSRASYLLGQYERKHGINFNSGTSLSPEAWAKSYPVLLRENGYFTGYVGKNHLPVGRKGYFTGLMDRSFDFWYAGHHHLSFYPKEKHDIFDHASSDTQTEIIAEGAEAFLDPDSNEALIRNAVGFLQTRAGDKPFCLSICLNLPHGSSTSTMGMRETDDDLYRKAYRDQQESLPLPPHYIAKQDIKKPKLPKDLLLTQLRQNNYLWVDTPKSVRERTIRTYQTITGIDRMVGQLCETLQKNGLEENTILIFSSDHGLFFGEHGLGGKSLCYDVTLKVPFLIYDPRYPVGQRRDDLVLSIDVAPTILSLAGVEIPDSMQGADLQPFIRDEPTQWRQYAYGENLWSNIFGNPRCETVRTKEYRYIRYFENNNLEKRLQTKPKDLYTVPDYMAKDYENYLTASIEGETVVYEELFHTASDPYEALNLAEDPAHQSALEELRIACQKMVSTAKGDINTAPSTLRVESKWTETNYRK